MKVVLLALALLISAGCANHTAADSIGATAQTTRTVVNVNPQIDSFPQGEKEKIDPEKRKALEAQNARFKVAPAEFAKVDFKNFKYPAARLKDGEFKHFQDKNLGSGWFSLEDVFYVDLNEDEKSEAVVLLGSFGCGGSCDGGRTIIYFYSARKGKPRLLAEIETGSRSGGCSLKSLAIKDRKIILEQFGNCDKNPTYEENRKYSCKFCVKDLTRSVYSFKNGELVRETSETSETPETGIMNYTTEISIGH
ncbi:MAG TPA: hypothetical protein VGB68_19940 [Pyrinomonadaceae bacterium]|jgi:hypothetical protein